MRGTRTEKLSRILLFLFILPFSCGGFENGGEKKGDIRKVKEGVKDVVIISDCALGEEEVEDTEDGIALFFALLSERACVRAIISTFGNVPEENAVKNIKKIVDLAEEEAVCIPEVIRGASSPSEKISEGAKYISDISEKLEGIYVISLGSLTTLKQAVEYSPSVTERIELFIMGGSVYTAGNVPATGFRAEFNFYFDPKSAKEVIRKFRAEIYPLDISYKFHVSFISDYFTGRIGKYIKENSEVWFDTPFAFLYDTLAVAGALYPEIITKKVELPAFVGEEGELIVGEGKEQRTQTFVLGIDGEKFREISRRIFEGK